MSSRKHPLSLAAVLVASLACGAKTGLRQPDAAVDAPEDVVTRFDACVAGRFNLVRRSAEILFVIDRSGSMSQALSQTDPTGTRWQAMRQVFARTLPMFESDVEMGVMIFPRVPLDTRAGSLQYCELSPGAGVDVAPDLMHAGEIIGAINANYPRGATPTAAAIRRATGYLQSREARGRARYILLATDGVPNCNRALDLATCTCIGPTGSCAATGSEFCLDDDGSVSAIDAARRAGVAVYVVGIDGDIEPQFRVVLDRMAVAGGRALSGASPRYYSINAYEQLVSAFTGIQRTVVQCSFVTPSRPDDPDAIDVTVGGTPILRDSSRREGWDWTDRDYGELTLYGSACETVISRRPTLQATVRCASP